MFDFLKKIFGGNKQDDPMLNQTSEEVSAPAPESTEAPTENGSDSSFDSSDSGSNE